jgi:transcriptional regulator with PAS, ATPase and Fis domain
MRPMTTAHSIPAALLPRDAQSILELAARSMFELFANASEGMLLVDRQARVVWINDQYRRFLPALGFDREADFVGHPVSAVVQNTLMHQVLETGKPILIDMLTNRAGTFVVSRIPLRDDGGEVIGALGIVLFDHAETNLQPLITKFARMQGDLDDARKELARHKAKPLSGQRRPKYGFANFVGGSEATLEVKRQARRAAQSASPVLLLGETGTGKELLAHAIHAASPRAAGPLVSVNLAAVPETLLEAEFFGVAPGAYTGADRKGRDGKFLIADGGTLFLDEVGDMPPALQAKLLRALQEGEIEPLGSNRLVAFDVRIVAATACDLPAMVREGRFREDLFYRLNVLPIRVPPLRERRSDLPAIIETVLEDIAPRAGLTSAEVEPAALALLQQQEWRGNVRQLRNVLEQALMRSERASIGASDLVGLLETPLPPPTATGVPGVAAVGGGQRSPADPGAGVAPTGEGIGATQRPLPEQVRELEQRAIAQALLACRGNRVAAARLLGISRATLYQRLAESAE